MEDWRKQFHNGEKIRMIFMDLSIKCDVYICDALRNLVPFVQFKKREKHSWMSVTLSKVAGFSFTKSNNLP